MSEEDDADVVGEPPVEKRPYIQVNRRDGVESDVFLHVLDDDETTQNPKCKNIFSFGDRDDSENELQGYTFSLPSDKLCDLITINDVDVEAKAAEQKVFESFEKGDFLVDMSQVVIKESAGSGTFGCVYRAEYKERVVAVKLFKDKGLLYRLAQEIFVLAKMRHPNIVEFIGVGWKKGCEWEPALFMEYCAKGSLFQLIYSPHELKATTRAEHHHNELDMNIKKIALGVARALTFVHSLGYAHLDICSANILLTEDMEPKLADFGQARRGFGIGAPNVGHMQYRAPELCHTKSRNYFKLGHYCEKADVYSYAILLWEIFHKEIPWSGADRVLSSVKAGKRPKINKDIVQKPWRKLIKMCWADKPADRPALKDVVTIIEGLP